MGIWWNLWPFYDHYSLLQRIIMSLGVWPIWIVSLPFEWMWNLLPNIWFWGPIFFSIFLFFFFLPANTIITMILLFFAILFFLLFSQVILWGFGLLAFTIVPVVTVVLLVILIVVSVINLIFGGIFGLAFNVFLWIAGVILWSLFSTVALLIFFALQIGLGIAFGALWTGFAIFLAIPFFSLLPIIVVYIGKNLLEQYMPTITGLVPWYNQDSFTG